MCIIIIKQIDLHSLNQGWQKLENIPISQVNWKYLYLLGIIGIS